MLITVDLTKLQKALIVVTLAILSIALCQSLFNHYYTHYIGNNYFPPGSYQSLVLLALIAYGLKISLSKHSRITEFFFQLLVYYVVLTIIAIATNSVQLTPFNPIDSYLIAFEKLFYFDNVMLLNWLSNYPMLRNVLTMSYSTLANQMLLVPVFCMLMRQHHRLYQHYFLLLFGLLAGFSIYYLWPSIAPASMLDSPLFLQAQLDTGLKFYQIRYHMQPTTLEGGLIAFPSFHAMWAWICLYTMRGYPLLWWPLAGLNLLLTLSCVLLGWHYLTDLIASAIILLSAHWALNRIENNDDSTKSKG